MGEIRTVTTLRHKKVEIERAIAGYETKIKQARADLAHINAAIGIFESTGNASELRAYVDMRQIWPRRALATLCKTFLEAEGPLNTRELTERAMKHRGLDMGDKVLSQAITFRIVQALRLQMIRGKIWSPGKVKGLRVWTVTPPASGADSSH
jgi:hypothetical protein